MTGIRFVVIATTARGALGRAEPLDERNQWRAFSAWREAVSREARAAFELSRSDRLPMRAGFGRTGAADRGDSG
jgi:hypothetical protein